MSARYDQVGRVLCAGVVISALWTASDVAGALPSALLVGWAALLYVLARRAPAGEADAPARGLEAPAASALAIGLAVCLPLAVWVARFRATEFPFIGDHNVHLRQLIAAESLWGMAYLPALATLALLLPPASRRVPPWAPVALVALWTAAGVLADPGDGLAVRYPAALHFVAWPLTLVTGLIGDASPLDPLRFANALAVPAWLFVLRPLVVGRWPDLRVLPYGFFLFFQKDVIYYFSGAYLEPWSCVMLALAVEVLVCGRRDEGWKAVLLAFAAPMFKEYAILLAPWVALAALLRAEGREERKLIALAGATGIVLFGFYYVARLRAGVFGASEFDPAGLAPERLLGYLERASQQYGVAAPVVLLLLAAVAWWSVRGGESSKVWAPLAAGIVALNVYFLCETLTYEWLGYPRYQIPTLAFIAAPLLRLEQLTTRSVVAGIAAAIAALQLVAAAPLFAAMRAPDMALNFFEHRDAPVYLPFRQLVEEAERRGLVDGLRAMHVVTNLHGVKRGYLPKSLPLAYPDIASRVPIDVAPVDFASLERCGCAGRGEAVVGLYVYFNGAESPDAPVSAIRNVAVHCRERMRQTCATSFALEWRGQIVGSFGR